MMGTQNCPDLIQHPPEWTIIYPRQGVGVGRCWGCVGVAKQKDVTDLNNNFVVRVEQKEERIVRFILARTTVD